MKTLLAGLLAMALSGADAKTDVKAAAQKLAGQSYAYTTTVKSEGGQGGGQQGRALGATLSEAKVDKDGTAVLTYKSGETTILAVVKGEKSAVKAADGWKASTEFQRGQGGQGQQRDPAAGVARGLRTYKAPGAAAEGLADKTKEIKDDGEGAYSGELTEEGVKELLSFGGRPGGNNQNAPQVADPKGSVKFWVKDGTLVKYEVNVQGKMTFGQREIVINRTTTVEIKDVGTATVEVPEEAKAKLQ
jgi:hypothetical protein